MHPGLQIVCLVLAGSEPPAEIITLKANGGWCWFQDERVIVVDDRLFIASVASADRDGASPGDVEVTRFDPATGERRSFTLSPDYQRDDHDVPALLALPDDRVLAVFQPHGGANGRNAGEVTWRISSEPGGIDAWTTSRTIDLGTGCTYANLARLSAEGGRIYDFLRAYGNDPCYLVSGDGGATFRFGGRLLDWPRPTADDPKFTGIDGSRPYLRYADNGVDEIHFIATEDHPRAYDNSVYHGFVRAGRVHRSDGTSIGPLSESRDSAIAPTDLTRVFEGDADRVAWTVDLELDAGGRPVAVFSVQVGDGNMRGDARAGGDDLRYWYARWDGARWIVNEMAHAGSALYAPEVDYAGLAAVDPNDPDVVFISTDADPVSGAPLAHYEIHRGVTDDAGATWTWTPVTQDSTEDNIRPVVPAWGGGRRAVLWMRGRYGTYVDYDTDIVGIVEITGSSARPPR